MSMSRLPPARFSIEALRAFMDSGLWTSKLKVSMPMSLSSEIVLGSRAVAKTRSPRRTYVSSRLRD